MFLLGIYGNNLYPGSLRLFSNEQRLLKYLYNEWLNFKQRYDFRIQQKDPWAMSFATFEKYIRRMSYRCYKINPDQDKETINIKRTTLAKWVRNYENKD